VLVHASDWHQVLPALCCESPRCKTGSRYSATQATGLRKAWRPTQSRQQRTPRHTPVGHWLRPWRADAQQRQSQGDGTGDLSAGCTHRAWQSGI